MCLNTISGFACKLTLLNMDVLVEFVMLSLLGVILYLVLQKSYQPNKKRSVYPISQQAVVDDICESWEPEPLHPAITNEMQQEPPVLESAASPHTIVNGKEVVNFTSADYLGLIERREIKEACTNALEKYGVGSCGPRGFYGTIDVHSHLEDKLAQFLGTPDAILYSYGLATASSAIPAFCKSGDIILADEGVNWGIQTGLLLSRSTIKYFKHNNMASLESLLEEVAQEDCKKTKRLNRRFIIVEAVYQNSGHMAPLDKIVQLRDKYHFRIFMEESNSIGVFGKTGRGLSEFFNIPVEKIDIITSAMGHALASTGGFCTGSAKVVDHQRLSGAGYVFSASLPPFSAAASLAAIEHLEQNPGLLVTLQRNIKLLRDGLSEVPGFSIGGHDLSPVIFLHLGNSKGCFKEDVAILQQITERMLEEESILVSVGKRSTLDKCSLPAGIRVLASAAHSESDIKKLISSLKRVAKSVIFCN